MQLRRSNDDKKNDITIMMKVTFRVVDGVKVLLALRKSLWACYATNAIDAEWSLSQ